MLNREARQLCQLFASVLDYPDSDLPRAAENCAQQLERAFPTIAGPAQSFADFVARQSLGSLEELYTQTFDITPATSLYLSYHLFGETPKRSEFLIQMTEAYKSNSFSPGIELVDHLGVMLRFFSICEDPEFIIPLLEECILPTLARIETTLEKSDNPYAMIIEPLLAFLRKTTGKLARTGGIL